MRESIEETWQFLAATGWNMPFRSEGSPFVAAAMPSHDDEEPRYSCFKTRMEDVDSSNLSLPRTFFGRSFFAAVSYANTGLSDIADVLARLRRLRLHRRDRYRIA
jgi:hypothetical protein